MVQEERSKESAAAAPVEMQRQPSTNTHPLLQDNSKSSLLLSRFNADSSSLSPSTLRRQASLARNFGRSEDDGSEKGFDDPLLRKSSLHDPLSSPLANEDALSHTPRSSRRTEKSPSDERAEAAAAEWDGYKASIMQRFTSSGTIKVSTNFDIISTEPKGRGKSVTAAHLQKLEDPEKEAREETTIISQQEYVTRLKALNEEISQAWLQKERVSALRLSIKVARLLSDSSVPQFYPTLFVLVTDVLDTVGNHVWDRIKKKAEFDDDGNAVAVLPVNFTADDVRQDARDTCQNWFYRIGSVKDLLPRFKRKSAKLKSSRTMIDRGAHALSRSLTRVVMNSARKSLRGSTVVGRHLNSLRKRSLGRFPSR